jgi:hypothetical protein
MSLKRCAIHGFSGVALGLFCLFMTKHFIPADFVTTFYFATGYLGCPLVTLLADAGGGE